LGLTLIVGVLAEMKGLGEDEGLRNYQSQFAIVNRALHASGLPEHREPVDLGDLDPVDLDMYGYSGLHYLRRIAAHLWAGNQLPPPGDKESIGANKDSIVTRYYSALDQGATTSRPKLFRRARPAAGPKPVFEHLTNHSDAEGFYIPVEFDRVIVDTWGWGITGGTVGSTQKLMQECETLARYLGLPLEIDPESNELWEATEHQGEGDTQWKRYAIESFTCSRLFHACRASMLRRAAITFT
jgi:hypothetical protein